MNLGSQGAETVLGVRERWGREGENAPQAQLLDYVGSRLQLSNLEDADKYISHYVRVVKCVGTHKRVASLVPPLVTFWKIGSAHVAQESVS